MSSIADTLSKVGLIDELSKPTIMKSPSVAPVETTAPIRPTDFSNLPDDEEQEDHKHVAPGPDQAKPETDLEEKEFEEEEQEEPYDPEAEAKKLVALCNAGNTLICSPIAVWKLKKNRGGAKMLDKMKQCWHKKGAGMKINEREEAMALQYESYLQDTKQLSGEILFQAHEIKAMEELALPYCRESKIKIHSGASFWTTYLGFQAQKVIKILTA